MRNGYCSGLQLVRPYNFDRNRSPEAGFILAFSDGLVKAISRPQRPPLITTGLLHRRIRCRAQDNVLHIGDDRAGFLGLRAGGQPFWVDAESVPLLLALGQGVPGQHVIQRLVGLADDRGPEASLLDAVLFSQLQRDGVEALVQVGQLARDAFVDTQFVDHLGSSWMNGRVECA
jgi:hypothetical protein